MDFYEKLLKEIRLKLLKIEFQKNQIKKNHKKN
jgi:hypothetical protein